jgi:hypothetical protein
MTSGRHEPIALPGDAHDFLEARNVPVARLRPAALDGPERRQRVVEPHGDDGGMAAARGEVRGLRALLARVGARSRLCSDGERTARARAPSGR